MTCYSSYHAVFSLYRLLILTHREQERRLANLDDQLKELQDARDLLASDSAHDLKCIRAVLSDKQEQLIETKQEVKTLQDLIDRNAHDFAAQMYGKNERIHRLEEEAELVRQQVDNTQLHDRIHQLQQQLGVQTTAASNSATKLERYVHCITEIYLELLFSD